MFKMKKKNIIFAHLNSVPRKFHVLMSAIKFATKFKVKSEVENKLFLCFLKTQEKRCENWSVNRVSSPNYVTRNYA